MGFVGYALVMYILWWDKPFSVEHTIDVNCPYGLHDEVCSLLQDMFEARYSSKFLSPTWKDFRRMQRIPNWAYMSDIGLG